jgi:hypothetical protein
MEGVTLRSAVKKWISIWGTAPISDNLLREVTDVVNYVVKGGGCP